MQSSVEGKDAVRARCWNYVVASTRAHVYTHATSRTSHSTVRERVVERDEDRRARQEKDAIEEYVRK